MIGVAVLALGLLAGLAFVRLNRTTKVVVGKVIETRERRTMTKRGPAQTETLVVQYEINGKSHRAEVSPPGNRATYGRSHVQVHYYPALPALVWYHNRGNGAVALCIAMAVLGLLVMAFSVGPMLKARHGPLPAK